MSEIGSEKPSGSEMPFLKCLLVRTAGGRVFSRVGQKDQVFIVLSSEEARVLAALADGSGDSDILLSASFDPNSADHLAELKRLLAGSHVLVMSGRPLKSPQLAEVVCEAQLAGIRLRDFEAALLELDPSVQTAPAKLIERMARSSIHQSAGLRFYALLKSVSEPLVGALLLLLLSPVLLFVALAVKFSSQGPVFYKQVRRGWRGKTFEIVKFRSMRIDAEKNGPVWASASKADQRLTPIGGFLRATHLDEIPQIWNVVQGEVSFIGPRPERPIFCEQLEKDIPLFKLRTLIKPGITGWAQVRAGYANSVDDSRRKLELDLYYLLKHSPAMDVRIVLDTLAILVTGGSEGRKRKRAMGARMRPVLPGLPFRRPVAPARLEEIKIDLGRQIT